MIVIPLSFKIPLKQVPGPLDHMRSDRMTSVGLSVCLDGWMDGFTSLGRASFGIATPTNHHSSDVTVRCFSFIQIYHNIYIYMLYIYIYRYIYIYTYIHTRSTHRELCPLPHMGQRQRNRNWYREGHHPGITLVPQGHAHGRR